jgi:hypothetical protein
MSRNKLVDLKWQETNIIRLLINRAKHRALAKGLTFSLTKEDLVLPSVCPILGIPIVVVRGQGRRIDGPSLDRKDNTKGYTKENTWIISDLANKMKSEASLEQLVVFADWVQRYKQSTKKENN